MNLIEKYLQCNFEWVTYFICSFLFLFLFSYSQAPSPRQGKKNLPFIFPSLLPNTIIISWFSSFYRTLSFYFYFWCWILHFLISFFFFLLFSFSIDYNRAVSNANRNGELHFIIHFGKWILSHVTKVL